MTFEFRPAVRRDVPLLILLAGGTGSGKTESALRLATGLANGREFAAIDTEHGRMLHKADDYKFKYAELAEPFTPERYAEAIHAAAAQSIQADGGFPVIVIDSGSHEWDGDGGVLDMQIAEYARMGGKESARMASWIDPKRRHKVYRNALVTSPAHVIVCHRAEDKIEIVKDGGKTVVRPKASLTGAQGWIPICERRLPFEATISLLLTQEHPGVPIPIKLEQRHADLVRLDAQLDEETGRRLAEWAAGGKVGSVQGPQMAQAEDGDAGTGGAESSEWADEAAVKEVLELAARVGDEEHSKTVDAIAKRRAKFDGRVQRVWLAKLSAALLRHAEAGVAS